MPDTETRAPRADDDLSQKMASALRHIVDRGFEWDATPDGSHAHLVAFRKFWSALYDCKELVREIDAMAAEAERVGTGGPS